MSKLNKPNYFYHYFSQLWERVWQDRMTILAGHLTYVSLLSLVPLITVIFSLFAAFPMFAEVSIQIKKFIFSNFVPAAGDTVEQYLDQFVANSNRMTIVGICGLVVTSLLLISSIDNAINLIWRHSNKRPFFYSFAVYFLVLTLGPLLVGGSITISSLILSQNWLHNSNVNGYLHYFVRLLPFLFSFLSFCVIYNLVPNVKVPLKNSTIGALVAALMFEFGKKLFSLYITQFPSYQLIYGVLATIPILFVWVYLSWCIVLFGVEVTVTLTERHQSIIGETETGSKQEQTEVKDS